MPTVIKACETGPLLRRLSNVDLADHLAEARSVIADAERRASRIVAGAEAEAAKALAAARQGGYEAGHRSGYTEGVEAGHQAAHKESIQRFEQQQDHLVAGMQAAIESIDEIKEGLRIAAEKDLLEFAVQVATKLTFAIGKMHRESAVENLERAIRLVGAQTDLTIRVHPDDLAAMDMFARDVLKQVNASRAVDLVADESLAPGGCLVDSGCTRIDATLETQVAEIVSLLLGGKAGDA